MDNQTAPRTLREATDRKTYDRLPYLKARNSIHGGYKSSSWPADDRRSALAAKIVILFIIASVIFWRFQ